MLWEATFSQNNQVNGMSYGKNVKKGMESCSCASKPSSTSSMVISSTISPTSVPTISTSSIASSSEHYPTNSTFHTSHPITSSTSTVESLSSSYMTTYDDVSMSSTASASPSASPSSCGIKGFDKSPAYNFLNDTTSANFEKCSARCAADSSCVSFAFGYTQCLLYTQTV
jgi:PAN-like domain